MLKHLDGQIEDEAFMRFSVACCRRIWPLITDARSKAVVEVTEKYLAGTLSAKAAGRVCAEWDRAYQKGEVEDLVGGLTNGAIESVYGVGYGHAVQVWMKCVDSAGYAASEPLRSAGAPQPEITQAWKAAEITEANAQCQLLRNLFKYPSTKKSVEAKAPSKKKRAKRNVEKTKPPSVTYLVVPCPLSDGKITQDRPGILEILRRSPGRGGPGLHVGLIEQQRFSVDALKN
jgi:hypothetical protein